LLHHVELWVPDLERAAASWGWLLERLGYERYQNWAARAHGRTRTPTARCAPHAPDAIAPDDSHTCLLTQSRRTPFPAVEAWRALAGAYA
jgi:catechol 2,3-dioxygenase-like lactoylglutathione lyase family enzyme